jgi:glucosamine-6-phosphate deaminase
VLGIGEDGHVAYNLPGPPVAETHLVTLPGALADRLEVPEAWRPLQAITVGLGSFQSARSLLLLATGDSKARAVRAMVEGPEDPDSPASLLRDHPDFTVLLDRAAAAQLC